MQAPAHPSLPFEFINIDKSGLTVTDMSITKSPPGDLALKGINPVGKLFELIPSL